MCANTILKLFFKIDFLLLCLATVFFVFAVRCGVKPGNDFNLKMR